MDRNKAYAYLLLGAVVLAGVGGFMFSESIFSDEGVEAPSISTGTISFTVLDSNIYSEGGDLSGETS